MSNLSEVNSEDSFESLNDLNSRNSSMISSPSLKRFLLK
jgi:hypothetical protein